MQLLKKRRVHRLVVVEGEEEEKKGGKRGRLMGIITLSDVLRYMAGVPRLGTQSSSIHPVEEQKASEPQSPITAPPTPIPSTPIPDSVSITTVTDTED
jgi:CBS domain-containing protein